jgi:hypothetical protein
VPNGLFNVVQGDKAWLMHCLIIET